MKNEEIFIDQIRENKHAYEGNLNLGICSCPLESKGGPCKQQHFVTIFKGKSCPNVAPATVKQKMKYHFVALGNSNVDSRWYTPNDAGKAVEDKQWKGNHDEAEIEPQNNDYDLIKTSPKSGKNLTRL